MLHHRIVLYLLTVPIRKPLPLVKNGDGIRKLESHAHVMFDHQDRNRRIQILEQPGKVVCFRRRKSGGRLIEQEEPGLAGKLKAVRFRLYDLERVAIVASADSTGEDHG